MVFDTQQFEKYLDNEKPPAPLGLLWLVYCNSYFQLDMFGRKSYFEDSDWVVRPLLEEMKTYAVHDSFYLLAIAHKQISLKKDDKATLTWIINFQSKLQSQLDE